MKPLDTYRINAIYCYITFIFPSCSYKKCDEIPQDWNSYDDIKEYVREVNWEVNETYRAKGEDFCWAHFLSCDKNSFMIIDFYDYTRNPGIYDLYKCEDYYSYSEIYQDVPEYLWNQFKLSKSKVEFIESKITPIYKPIKNQYEKTVNENMSKFWLFSPLIFLHLYFLYIITSSDEKFSKDSAFGCLILFYVGFGMLMALIHSYLI